MVRTQSQERRRMTVQSAALVPRDTHDLIIPSFPGRVSLGISTEIHALVLVISFRTLVFKLATAIIYSKTSASDELNSN